MDILTDDEFQLLDEYCREYIDKKCIIRRGKGEKMMPGKKPGTWYTWIFYLRNGLYDRDFLHSICVLFLHKIQKEIGHFNFQIAGMETGSTPMLAALPLVAQIRGIDLHSFSIRKQRKEYGLLNMIEGIPNDKPVLLLDDLCNSSISLKKAYDVLVEEELPIMPYAYAIVNKVNKEIHPQLRQTTDMYLDESIKILYQYDLDDFDLKNPSH